MTDLIVAPMTSTAVHSCTPPRDSNIESEVGEEGHSVEQPKQIKGNKSLLQGPDAAEVQKRVIKYEEKEE